MPVRVIDAQITIATKAGRITGVYRLVTTLLDPHRYPAFDLVGLYHERWEIETANPVHVPTAPHSPPFSLIVMVKTRRRNLTSLKRSNQ